MHKQQPYDCTMLIWKCWCDILWEIGFVNFRNTDEYFFEKSVLTKEEIFQYARNCHRDRTCPKTRRRRWTTFSRTSAGKYICWQHSILWIGCDKCSSTYIILEMKRWTYELCYSTACLGWNRVMHGISHASWQNPCIMAKTMRYEFCHAMTFPMGV